jgi:GTP-binding protein EngB required for normal cell division
MYVQRRAVPIVVVFTQFDKLVNRMEQELTDEEEDMPEERITQLCLQRAVAEFKKACVGPLERIDSRSKLTYARSSGLIIYCK